MNKIRGGDRVIVIAGRDKGARGEVTRVIMDARGKPERVVVDGVNMVSHFVRPNPQKNEPGGITRREASLHVSNVAVVDEASGQPTRARIARIARGGDGDGGDKSGKGSKESKGSKGGKSGGMTRKFEVSKRRQANAAATPKEDSSGS